MWVNRKEWYRLRARVEALELKTTRLDIAVPYKGMAGEYCYATISDVVQALVREVRLSRVCLVRGHEYVIEPKPKSIKK